MNIYDSKNKIDEHNQIIYDNENPHKDSGFDLYNPEELMMKVNECNKMNLRVKCAMVRLLDDNTEVPCGFYLYPRSSISKTKFRLQIMLVLSIVVIVEISMRNV